MGIAIIVRGAKTQVSFQGARAAIVPFIGIDEGNSQSLLGIGAENPANPARRLFWGLPQAYLAVQSWRAMKLMERVDCITNGTLTACWFLACRTLNDEGLRRYLPLIVGSAGDLKRATAHRRSILALAPHAQELEMILAFMRIRGLPVEAWELETEVREGRIDRKGLVAVVLAEDESRRRAEIARAPAEPFPAPTLWQRFRALFN